ncbi:MAG TPA: zinc ribbon domain-containing protein [Candidatus Kapabacteria bacterium]|jgi:putative FmdB family regulatory protein|nr:zinc ribbon domain-containing protein [Candidatus Kapabacteria bacterium]
MPTYEYRCRYCHELVEAFQRMSDAPLIHCPHCNKEGLERIVSGGAGVIYKGEGWYVTDYSKKSSGGKESESTQSNSGKGETKVDSTKESTTTSKVETSDTTSVAPPANPAPSKSSEGKNAKD